jgi:hypothetical protein
VSADLELAWFQLVSGGDCCRSPPLEAAWGWSALWGSADGTANLNVPPMLTVDHSICRYNAGLITAVELNERKVPAQD